MTKINNITRDGDYLQVDVKGCDELFRIRLAGILNKSHLASIIKNLYEDHVKAEQTRTILNTKFNDFKSLIGDDI